MKIGKYKREKTPMPKDDRLIFLVFTAQLKLRTYLKNTLSEAGVTITPAQSGILFLLKSKDGQTMSELSQVLSLDNSTLTGLVDRLERSGFVKRNASTADRRASHVFITEKGSEEINRAGAVIRRVNEQIKADFTESEVEAFKKILKSFFARFVANA
jgi:MarR family transcriptional regulator, organic hydroperoxide resistance regulator